MGFVKKSIKKLTGVDDAEKAAREQAEQARRQAEELARQQAELEAAQQAASSIGADKVEGTELGAEDKHSTQKKKLKAGKKSLSIARSSGSGINI